MLESTALNNELQLKVSTPIIKSDWVVVINTKVRKVQMERTVGCLVECKSSLDLAPLGRTFGLGIDRIDKLLFEIPDIRLLWTAKDSITNLKRDILINPKYILNIHVHLEIYRFVYRNKVMKMSRILKFMLMI